MEIFSVLKRRYKSSISFESNFTPESQRYTCKVFLLKAALFSVIFAFHALFDKLPFLQFLISVSTFWIMLLVASVLLLCIAAFSPSSERKGLAWLFWGLHALAIALALFGRLGAMNVVISIIYAIFITAILLHVLIVFLIRRRFWVLMNSFLLFLTPGIVCCVISVWNQTKNVKPSVGLLSLMFVGLLCIFGYFAFDLLTTKKMHDNETPNVIMDSVSLIPDLLYFVAGMFLFLAEHCPNTVYVRRY